MTQSVPELNGFALYPVQTASALTEAVAYLTEQPRLALDLEFDRNRYSYGFTLCLVQVAAGSRCFLVDPFAVSDLSALWALLADPARQKLMHCGNEDVRLLKTLGCQPRHLFDTDVAARIMNHERTSLLNVLSEVLGVSLDKSSQRSNWNKRPLTDAQWHYAASDVVYLPALADYFAAQLDAEGRRHWLDEEMERLEAVEEGDIETAHLRLKGAKHLSPYEQHVLSAAHADRELRAEALNKPPFHLMHNELLLQLATEPLPPFQTWRSTKGLHPQYRSPKGYEQLRALLADARREAEARDLSPRVVRRRRPRTPDADKRKTALQAVQRELAERYGTHAARMLLTATQVRELAEGGETLDILRDYARSPVAEAAAAVATDLSPYEPS